MNRPLLNDQSMSIELDDEDLLDIDGSDDPTAAFSGKAVLAKLRPPPRKERGKERGLGRAAGQSRVPASVAPAPAPMPAHLARPVEDPTLVMSADRLDRLDREDVRETIPIPMRLLPRTGRSSPPAAAAPVPASMAPKSPTISPVPPMKRNATSSYPPIAVSLGPHRERAMSFVSERPSRAGWITAAVIGVLVLVGGSIKVATPKAPAVEPPPAVAAAEPVAPAEAQEEPKVVTFGDHQAVSIKVKPVDAKPVEAKPDPKPEAKKPAPAPHAVASKPAAKPASKPDTSLALSKDKEDKIPSTSHDGSSASSSISKADQKKLRSIEQDLADLQLKAAAR